MLDTNSHSDIEDMAEALVIDARAASDNECKAGRAVGASTLEHMQYLGEQLISEVKRAIIRHQSATRDMEEAYAMVIMRRLYFNR